WESSAPSSPWWRSSRWALRSGLSSAGGSRSRSRTSGRPFHGRRALVGGRRRGGLRRIRIAEDDRQAVLAAADDDDLRIWGLRKLECRLDAAPAQVGIRYALAHDLLKCAYPFRLDLLALRLPSFPLDSKFVFLREVVLLGLAIDRVDHGRRQLDA